jgi:hypothetical protein
MQRTPQFITGDFEPHWCFLPDDEYSRALDALVKVIALFAHASPTVRMCGALPHTESRDVFTILEIESSTREAASKAVTVPVCVCFAVTADRGPVSLPAIHSHLEIVRGMWLGVRRTYHCWRPNAFLTKISCGRCISSFGIHISECLCVLLQPFGHPKAVSHGGPGARPCIPCVGPWRRIQPRHGRLSVHTCLGAYMYVSGVSMLLVLEVQYCTSLVGYTPLGVGGSDCAWVWVCQSLTMPTHSNLRCEACAWQ